MGNSLASATADGSPHPHKHLEQIVVPIVCFSAIVAIHVRYLRTWLKPSEWANPLAIVDIRDVHNLRTFFVGIRTRWVLENHGRTQIAVQTLRDMLSVTTAIASAAMAFISIFIGLSKSSSASLLTCDPHDGENPCNTFEERLKFARFSLCIANFVIVFFNMLLATRYSVNSSFMLNTKMVDGKPLSQMLTVHVLARASFHYTLGIRGFFLAAPLVAWLFGSWLLLGTTVFYLCGVYLMEEDFLLGDEVWSPLPDSLSAASLALLEQEQQQRQGRGGPGSPSQGDDASLGRSLQNGPPGGWAANAGKGAKQARGGAGGGASARGQPPGGAKVVDTV